MPVVLYGCEAWFLILREECRLRVFENKILRKKCEPKRQESWKWKRQHNDELSSFYGSSSKVRVIKHRRLGWAGHVARVEEDRSALSKSTEKKLLRRLRLRWGQY